MRAEIYNGAETKIANFCFIDYQKDIVQIVSKALDGTQHIQIIGKPSSDITAYMVCTVAQRVLLENAYSTGDICRIETSGGYKYGVIKSLDINRKIYGGEQRINAILAEVQT